MIKNKLIKIDDELYRQVKSVAASKGWTMIQMVEYLFKMALCEKK